MRYFFYVMAVCLIFFGAYSWLVLGELNTFQKICYTLGVLLIVFSFFISGSFALVAAPVGSLFICISCYNHIQEYLPR